MRKITPTAAKISALPLTPLVAAKAPAIANAITAITHARGMRENGPGSWTRLIMGSEPAHDPPKVRSGGGDPRQAPAAMRHRPPAVGDLVLLVLGARVDAGIALEGPVLRDRSRAAVDAEADHRPLPSVDH